MKPMIHGDRFNEEHMYLSYHKSGYTFVTTVYVFKVTNGVNYESHNLLYTNSLLYIAIDRKYNNITKRYISEINDDFPYHVLNSEIWELSEDEADSIIAEVI
jgi:hypothetical protein